MSFVGVVLFGYLLGSCPWGYWLVLLFRGEDVRRHGSGNIGVTNVWRVYGRSLAIPLFVLDFGKGFVPAAVGVLAVSHDAGVAAGAAAMVGHWRPLFLGFKRGGKMIATSGGVLFAIAPLVALTCCAVWLTLFALLGYSSVASVTASALTPVCSWAYGYPASVTAFAAVAAVAIAFLHRSNLRRLRNRTESRWNRAALWRLFPPVPSPPQGRGAGP